MASKKEQATKELNKAKEKATDEIKAVDKKIEQADDKVEEYEEKSSEANEKAKQANGEVEQQVEKERSRFYKMCAAIWKRIKGAYQKLKQFLVDIWNKIIGLFKKKVKVAGKIDNLKKRLKELKKQGGGAKASKLRERLTQSSTGIESTYDDALKAYKQAQQIYDMLDDKIAALEQTKVKGKEKIIASLKKHRDAYEDILDDFKEKIEEIKKARR